SSSGQNGSQSETEGGHGGNNGSGSQNGNGNSNDDGQSNGANGNGAGLGSGNRIFLTIPERIDGKVNLENDFGKIGEGKEGEYFESDGPVEKGKLRSYDEVFEAYERAYRNSLNRVNLPKDLENIIKNYFSNLKP